jgi:hypothetical protein
MAYSSAKIDILFIKNGRSIDDVVTIKKNLEFNEFEVTYTENADLATPNVFKSTGMYREKVLQYIYMMVKNQYVDDEASDKIQVNIPAMPCVLISSSKLKDVYYREHVYELVSTGLDLLETTEVVKAKKLLRSSRRSATLPVAPPTPAAARLPSSPKYIGNSNYYPTEWYDNPNYVSASVRSSDPGVVPQHLFWDE